MNSSQNASTPPDDDNPYEYQQEEINLYYAICELLVAVFAVVGNALVIFVFRKERRLRRRTNYYIVSLAAADFLVGLLGIPFAIMSSMGLPTNLHACLFTVSTLVVLCTISIFCLVAVSVDRYWAILYPMGYSRNVRTKTAIVIISICWVAGGIVGFLPLLGWHKDAPSDGRCFFLDVMDYNYLVFLYFGTIITPALLLAAFYAHIYQVVLKQLRRIVTMNPGSSSSTCSSSGGTMLRMLGAAQKREVKATQNLSIIVLFFMICWIPLYTINCVLAFCRTCRIDSIYMLSCIILSHLNSAGNPLLYAYHLKDFRAALKNFFCSMFGYPEQQVVAQANLRASMASNNNYKMHNNSTNSRSRRRKKSESLQMVPKISTIVKNSATLAAATTGNGGGEMWNIPEGSDSSDELQEVCSAGGGGGIINKKMARPATPYSNSQINQAFIETSSDDVFLDEKLFPFGEFVFNEAETSLTDKLKSDVVRIVPQQQMSNSSPQLGTTRNLFFIEDNYSSTDRRKIMAERFSRSISCVGGGFEFERFDVMLIDKRMVRRSLSDDCGSAEGAVSKETLNPDGDVD